MARRLKICILGNSVALRNRPVEKYPNNKNYGALLEEIISEKLDVSLINKAVGRATVLDFERGLDGHINEFPDYYILNIGVCDAATRPVPYWYGEIINNSHKNTFLKTVLSSIYYRLIKPYSPFFVKLRGKRSWVSAKRFKRSFQFIVSELIKDTNSRIIIMSINNVNDRLENIVPGSGKKYQEYNRIMKEIADEESQIFLDTTDMIDVKHYPDGTHFNIEGNKEIANRLSRIIIEDV